MKSKCFIMKSKLTKENFQDLNTMTDEQNLEMQKKFDEALKEELSKPENQEFLRKWNEDGSKKNETRNIDEQQ
jgi:hypothetical protein